MKVSEVLQRMCHSGVIVVVCGRRWKGRGREKWRERSGGREGG